MEKGILVYKLSLFMMLAETRFGKSKSVGNLSKARETEGSPLLMDVENEKIVEHPEESDNSDVFTTMNLTQLAMLLSAFCSVSVCDKAHIMSEICRVFKNATTLSPNLFNSPITQMTINMVLVVPSISIILSLLFVKLNLISEQTIQKPGQFFRLLIYYVGIVCSVHFGESFGFYFTNSSVVRIVNILSLVFCYIIWNIGFYCLHLLKIVDYHETFRFYLIIQNMPVLVQLINSLCLNGLGGAKGVLILGVFDILFYIAGIIYKTRENPFPVKLWNIRILTTLSSCLLIRITHIINYFFPQMTAFDMNIAFFGSFTLILLEYKLSGSKVGKIMRSTKTNKTYSEEIDDFMVHPRRFQRPLIDWLIQDYAVSAVFLFSIVFMTFLNAIAAQRMPITRPLPDFMHEWFPIAERIRSSEDFKSQFSNIICALLIPAMCVLACCVPEVTNNRKVFFLYAILSWARGAAFIVTSLPAPCSGISNCPCADPAKIAYINTFSPVVVAVIWVFGIGMFAPVPQCGDLIISGHTMFMWLTFKWFVENSRRIVKKSTVFVVQVLCLFTFLVAVSYIIVARNHYTVDCVFGWIVSECFYDIYASLEKKAVFTNNKSLIVRIVRWFEIREYEITRKNFDEEIEPVEQYLY